MCALRFTSCLVAARENIFGHFDFYVKFVKFGNLIGLCVQLDDGAPTTPRRSRLKIRLSGTGGAAWKKLAFKNHGCLTVIR